MILIILESAMTDLIPSQFVSPSPRSELNGELGLDLHEIAKSLGARFPDVKEKYLRMEKDNRIKGVAYTAHVDQGPIRGVVEVQSYVLDLDSAKFFVAKWDSEVGDAYTRFLIQCEKKLEKAQFQLETLFTDPRKGAELLTKVAELKEEKDALAARIPQLESERDHAIKTKGQISSNKAATSMVRLSNLVQYMRKRGIPIPAYAEIDSEEGALERVRELEELLKKHDAALEAYRRKEDLQEEKNLTYIPTSKNGTGFNEVLKRWGYTLTVGNNRDINKVIRCYLSNIGGEILWADSTFKGAPSKRCLWHPQFLDENKGRILNFLKNEGWLKKA
jgi:phage anti-repressor protein